MRREIPPPFANCKYLYCDLPGQCISEGSCHHPLTVEQELSEEKLREIVAYANDPATLLQSGKVKKDLLMLVARVRALAPPLSAETPRVDELLAGQPEFAEAHERMPTYYKLIKLARKLEKENAALKMADWGVHD